METFSISTPDPRFDPNKPLKVNGYLFVPAGGGMKAKTSRPLTMIDGAKRKLARVRS